MITKLNKNDYEKIKGSVWIVDNYINDNKETIKQDVLILYPSEGPAFLDFLQKAYGKQLEDISKKILKNPIFCILDSGSIRIPVLNKDFLEKYKAYYKKSTNAITQNYELIDARVKH